MKDESEQLSKLPSWEACLDAMREGGIEYGKQWSAEFFEEHLKQKRDSMEFSLSVSAIRRALEGDGFFLSGRGHGGLAFEVVPPNENANVMRLYSRAAADALRRGVILGTSTPLDTLSASERQRHERLLERIATKAILIQRSQQVFGVVKKRAPKLLE